MTERKICSVELDGIEYIASYDGFEENHFKYVKLVYGQKPFNAVMIPLTPQIRQDIMVEVKQLEDQFKNSISDAEKHFAYVINNVVDALGVREMYMHNITSIVECLAIYEINMRDGDFLGINNTVCRSTMYYSILNATEITSILKMFCDTATIMKLRSDIICEVFKNTSSDIFTERLLTMLRNDFAEPRFIENVSLSNIDVMFSILSGSNVDTKLVDDFMRQVFGKQSQFESALKKYVSEFIFSVNDQQVELTEKMHNEFKYFPMMFFTNATRMKIFGDRNIANIIKNNEWLLFNSRPVPHFAVAPFSDLSYWRMFPDFSMEINKLEFIFSEFISDMKTLYMSDEKYRITVSFYMTTFTSCFKGMIHRQLVGDTISPTYLGDVKSLMYGVYRLFVDYSLTDIDFQFSLVKICEAINNSEKLQVLLVNAIREIYVQNDIHDFFNNHHNALFTTTYMKRVVSIIGSTIADINKGTEIMNNSNVVDFFMNIL